MEIFSALVALCVGNSPVTGEFHSQRPVTRSSDVFFDLCLNKWFSKQSRCWWFETPPCSLWRHCNDLQDRTITTCLAIGFDFKGHNPRCQDVHLLRSRRLINLLRPSDAYAPEKYVINGLSNGLIGAKSLSKPIMTTTVSIWIKL